MKPDYYKAGNMDVIAFCQYHNLGFAEGNIIKYVTRAGKKTENPIEDLKKAKEYLERLIQNEEAKWKELDTIQESIDKIKNGTPLTDEENEVIDSNGVSNKYLGVPKMFSTPYDNSQAAVDNFNTLLNQGYWNLPLVNKIPSEGTLEWWAEYFKNNHIAPIGAQLEVKGKRIKYDGHTRSGNFEVKPEYLNQYATYFGISLDKVKGVVKDINNFKLDFGNGSYFQIVGNKEQDIPTYTVNINDVLI